VALETLLTAADVALRAGDTIRAMQLLSAVNADLDIFTHRGLEAFSVSSHVQNTLQAQLERTFNYTGQP
jgi:hypothetical protein